jgi:hypothetical protein
LHSKDVVLSPITAIIPVITFFIILLISTFMASVFIEEIVRICREGSCPERKCFLPACATSRQHVVDANKGLQV